MSTKNTKKTKASVLVKTLAMPILIFFIFFEELLLKPMRSWVFPGIQWVIHISPPWMVISIFSVLEITKIGLKMLLVPYAFSLGFWYGAAAFIVYLFVSFLVLQIMIHGSQKLRSYKWFNTMYEWINKKIEPLKEYKKEILEWFSSLRFVRISKVIVWKMRKNKNTFLARAIAQARKWRHGSKQE